MRNPRLYALLCCVGLIGRALYRGILAEVSRDPSSWEAFVLLWLPIGVLIGMGVSLIAPILTRNWRTFRRKHGWRLRKDR